MDWFAYEPSFRERMDEAQDAARRRIEDNAYMAVRIDRKRRKRTMKVDQAAALLEMSTARVRLLCQQGRLVGAMRAEKGKGRPWVIPEPVTMTEGSRGPQLKRADSVTMQRRPDMPF